MTTQMTEGARRRTEALSQLHSILDRSRGKAAYDGSLSVLRPLVTDSRLVEPGDTFVAYPGEKTDGRLGIAQAITRGATAVIYEQHLADAATTRMNELTTPASLQNGAGYRREVRHFAWNDAWQIPHLAVGDLRHKAGWLASAVYGAPSEKMWVVGITGTNGKTSISHWLARSFGAAGKKCALIGTLGNGFVGALMASANTTPDAISVQRLLADYLSAEARVVAMEVSSHALVQGRVTGVNFDVALLSNLSRDHLDYHGDMESYAASKLRLLSWQELKFAVINLDDAFGAELAEQLRDGESEVIGYGMSDSALQLAERLGLRMVYGKLSEMNRQGMCLDIHSSWGAMQVNSTLIGRFNASNLLGALAVLLVSDVMPGEAAEALSLVQAVDGRMQRMGGDGRPAVIVDYAHTPDALEKVLLALREIDTSASGRLICLFGCGGDRDRGKRAMMGLVAEKFSDHCIVTSDNPRNEDPRQIIAEVLSGMAAGNHEIIVDRAAAIESAIGQARQEDIVLVAGKGHEDYQEIMGIKQPFSDVAVAERALRVWRGRP